MGGNGGTSAPRYDAIVAPDQLAKLILGEPPLHEIATRTCGSDVCNGVWAPSRDRDQVLLLKPHLALFGVDAAVVAPVPVLTEHVAPPAGVVAVGHAVSTALSSSGTRCGRPGRSRDARWRRRVAKCVRDKGHDSYRRDQQPCHLTTVDRGPDQGSIAARA
jgi:hypothetical protein